MRASPALGARRGCSRISPKNVFEIGLHSWHDLWGREAVRPQPTRQLGQGMIAGKQTPQPPKWGIQRLARV